MKTADPRGTDHDIDARLAALQAMPRKRLLEEFEQVYRRTPPLRLSDRILRLAIAYRLQEQAYGGLDATVRKMLLAGSSSAVARPTRPGTVLMREWQGHEHTVVVHADRVEYAGERFRSLTEVALRITGQKRSGPAFFGLRAKTHA